MEEEESPRIFTHSQVINLLKQQRASVEDYLILTYFRINNITEGPLFEKHKRHLNNIIVNNITEVSKRLACDVFRPKIDEILTQEFLQVRYISVIYPNLTKGRVPVMVQFFNPGTGLQHRILGYPVREPIPMVEILTQHGLLDKLVGYCGDFCYKDSAAVNSTSDRVNSLRTLSRNRVFDLPYSETFINRLFDLLVDYLPDDVINSVIKLGETVMGLSGNSQIAKDLVKAYKVWLSSSQHILLSDYLDFVISNFDALNSYLQPFKHLPQSLESLFSNVFQRFLLVFMREIYHEVDTIKLCDNSAVVYYFYLLRISNTFQDYQSNHHIPTKAWTFLNAQVGELVTSEEVDPQVKENLDKLYKEVSVTIDYTYTRAVMYMEPLLKHLENFAPHSWVLLNNIPVKFEHVHISFHTLHTSCDNCQSLEEELKFLNAVLPKLPLLEISSVLSRWLLVLQECGNGQVPMVTDLLKFLFALPSNYRVTGDLGGENDDDCIVKYLRMNMASVKDVDVDNVEEFFEGYMPQARKIVEDKFISILED